MAMVAMEPPVTLSAEDIQNEKLKLLRSVHALDPKDLLLAQYEGYREEWAVRTGSTTPTYAACVLKIDNRRWHGVPFLLKAAKGVDDKTTVIRIQFKEVPGRLYDSSAYANPTNQSTSNQLIIRIQPDEGIFLRVSSKVPGLETRIDPSRTLRLSYKDTWREELLDLPDAYERVLLDVMKGDSTLFVRPEELLSSWRIFDSALRSSEEVLEDVSADKHSCTLLSYSLGSTGPITAAQELAARHGAWWTDTRDAS
jgi:glucose-6-phosphate 1-dehydrogenase